MFSGADLRYFVITSDYPDFPDTSKNLPESRKRFPDFDNFWVAARLF